MTINLTTLLSEDPKIPWCYTCQGDGYLVYVGGPGYYSTYFGNYLPTESLEPCDDCHGSGRNDDGNSPTNAVRQLLRALTPSQRLHLQRLTQGHRLPITPANYQALEDLFCEVDNELGGKHPRHRRAGSRARQRATPGSHRDRVHRQPRSPQLLTAHVGAARAAPPNTWKELHEHR